MQKILYIIQSISVINGKLASNSLHYMPRIPNLETCYFVQICADYTYRYVYKKKTQHMPLKLKPKHVCQCQTIFEPLNTIILTHFYFSVTIIYLSNAAENIVYT